MTIAYEILRIASLLLFSALAATALLRWRKNEDESAGWLGATFGVLVLVLVASELIPQRANTAVEEFGVKTEVALFSLFPYLLFRFMNTFLPSPRWLHRLALASTALVIVTTFAVALPAEDEPETTAVQLLLALLVLNWVALSLLVSIRFWRAGAGQPALVRFRVRAMASGTASLGIALILAAQTRGTVEIDLFSIVVQLLVLASAGLFAIGFSPPPALRRSWAYLQEDPIRLVRDLATYASTRVEIAERALRNGLRLLAAEAGFVADAAGRTLASQALSESDVEELAKLSRDDPLSVRPLSWTKGRFAIMAAIPGAEGTGLFCVLSGPFTPFFGDDDIERLRDYAQVVGESLERVRITEQLGSLISAIGDLGEGYVVTESGRLVAANNQYVAMTGYTLEELESVSSLIELAPEEDRPMLVERLRSRLAGGAVTDHYEGRLQRKDGAIVDVETSIKITHQGDRPRLIALVRDITERKRIDDFRTRFIADAAHELRTPIATLLGIAEMLDDPGVRHKREQLLHAMRRSGERTRLLIKNLLDLSRLQRGIEFRMERIDVHALVEAAIAAVPPPDGVTVTKEIDDHISVLTDPDRIDEALANLLTNAYRYGGNEVVVKALENPRGVTICIEDNGPGVESSLVPTLFEPFTRGTRSSDQGGSGLGLAIVKGIVEGAGGRIDYRPRRPRGSSFSLYLPDARSN